MSKKWKPPGSPWTAARGLVIFRHGTWSATVTNWYGLVVWGDNTGPAGWSELVRSTQRMTEAIRLIDGIGQGHRLKRWSEL